MNKNMHLEAIKEESAVMENLNRELSVYCARLIDILSEVSQAFLYDNERYRVKVENLIKMTPKQCLAENDAQVIERLAYSGCPIISQEEIKAKLIECAEKTRSEK